LYHLSEANTIALKIDTTLDSRVSMSNMYESASSCAPASIIAGVTSISGAPASSELSELAQEAVSEYRRSVKCIIAKAFFGKAWRKQAEIWKSLEKRLGGCLYFAASARGAPA
jgi:hypothetical protein